MKHDVDEALQRARTHLQQATLEGLEAARALLEAAMYASGLTATSGDSLVDQLHGQLEELISGLRESGSFVLPSALAEGLADAIDTEIERWETRSQTDADARPVLRAFLGLRELLWEFGLRRDPPPKGPESPPDSHPGEGAPPKRERVQRFDIED